MTAAERLVLCLVADLMLVQFDLLRDTFGETGISAEQQNAIQDRLRAARDALNVEAFQA